VFWGLRVAACIQHGIIVRFLASVGVAVVEVAAESVERVGESLLRGEGWSRAEVKPKAEKRSEVWWR